MTPTKPQWLRVKSLLEQALDLPDAQREAFVVHAECDTETRAELRSLLRHHMASSVSNPGTPGFMNGSASSALAGSLGDGSADPLAGQAARVGQRLGAWEIVRPVGSGGMGEVFEARRADGQYEGRARPARRRRMRASVRAWVLLLMLVMLVLLVRLAQAPLGESAAGRNLRSGLVARARRQQADCVGRGVVTAAGANTHPEARWLAGEPA